MKKAIKTKLIKSINELYFRNYKKTEFQMIREDVTQESLVNLLSISEKIGRETAIYKQCNDLYEELFGFTKNYIPLSEIVEPIRQNYLDASNIVQLGLYSNCFKGFIKVSDILTKASKESYLVGGAIRDLLMSKIPKDFDFVTDVPYDKLIQIFTKAGYQVKETGKQFLVVIVSKDGADFEIANFRKDKDNEGAQIGTKEEDADRRDFTVNAMYFNLHTKEISDPNGTGLDDINAKVLKFIGSAKQRIVEDPIRVYRFYRFLATKDLRPDPKTLRAVREMFEEATLTVNANRIRVEIERTIIVPKVKV